jgi:alkaline phosphatase
LTICNNLENSENPKLWALFGEYSMPYNIDRDTSKVPSLAEMTDIAITKLAQNPKGFFLW